MIISNWLLFLNCVLTFTGINSSTSIIGEKINHGRNSDTNNQGWNWSYLKRLKDNGDIYRALSCKAVFAILTISGMCRWAIFIALHLRCMTQPPRMLCGQSQCGRSQKLALPLERRRRRALREWTVFSGRSGREPNPLAGAAPSRASARVRFVPSDL